MEKFTQLVDVILEAAKESLEHKPIKKKTWIRTRNEEL
jgi:hypothetical protein